MLIRRFRGGLPISVLAAIGILVGACGDEPPADSDAAAAADAGDAEQDAEGDALTDPPTDPSVDAARDVAVDRPVDQARDTAPDRADSGEEPPADAADTGEDPATDAADATDAIDVGDTSADTSSDADAADAADVPGGECGVVAVIDDHTPYYREGDTDSAEHVWTPPCSSGDAPEDLYHIDLSGAAGDSDVVVYADCQAGGFDCALYLFGGPADACDIEASDVSDVGTVCVDETGIATAYERLEALDLAPGHYYLAVDGSDGSEGGYNLWVKVYDAGEDCSLYHEEDIDADFSNEVQNNATGFERLRLWCDGGEVEGSPEHIYPIEMAGAGSITFDLTCASIADNYDCAVGFAWGTGACDLTQADMDLQFFGCFDDTSTLSGDESGCVNVVGGRYFLIVDGVDGAMGEYDLEIDLGATITDEPCALETSGTTCGLREVFDPIAGDIVISDSNVDDGDRWVLPDVSGDCSGNDQGTGTGDAVWEFDVASNGTEINFAIDCDGDCALVVVDADPSGVCELTQAELNSPVHCEDTFLDEDFNLTLDAGSYYVIVTSEDADAELSYELTIDYNP